MVSVKLRNDVKEFENGTTPYEIVKGFGGGFFKQVCACKMVRFMTFVPQLIMIVL